MALPKRYKSPLYWLGLAALAGVVLFVVPNILRLIHFRTMDLDNRLAVMTAYAYLVIGLMMAVTYLFQPEAETGAARPSWRHKAATAGSFIATGLALLIPVLGPMVLPPAAVFAAFLICLGVVFATNAYFLRYSDELMRQAMIDMYVISYRLGSSLLLVYGAAWTLGYHSVGPWGLAAIMMMIHMGAGIWAGFRRGFGKTAEA